MCYLEQDSGLSTAEKLVIGSGIVVVIILLASAILAWRDVQARQEAVDHHIATTRSMLSRIEAEHQYAYAGSLVAKARLETVIEEIQRGQLVNPFEKRVKK